MYRGGLDRFKKAQALEPFSVSLDSAPKSTILAPKTGPSAKAPIDLPAPQIHLQNSHLSSSKPVGLEAISPTQPVTQVGGGQSTWQPPDWAIEPRPGFHYLEVMKDGEVLDKINLDKRKHIFGRQVQTCDFVLDHQSVSRQHAVVVPHKNGSVYVIDLGSVHGTFVANERLTKDNPVELEVGQSLRFAASTRTYILRKNTAVLFPTHALPEEIKLPPPPDPSDEEAVLAYNTMLNRYGLTKSDLLSKSNNSLESVSSEIDNLQSVRPAKKRRKSRVAFKDQIGGALVEVVGISDGADVETEPGPIGVKEGSLVGKYESLIQTTVIPKGKEHISLKEDNISSKGVTNRLQQVLSKIRSTPKGGIYDDLYGDSFSSKIGWAYKSDGQTGIFKGSEEGHLSSCSAEHNVSSVDDSDDLFGD